MDTTTTTVFWPDDVYAAGICYGWSEPCICIAGVLPTKTPRPWILYAKLILNGRILELGRGY
jgi:hypothetical protein